MKYIAYFKMNPEDIDKVLAKYNVIQEERRKHPDMYPKPLSPNYSFSIEKGFRLYESTEEQLTNIIKRWIPEIKMTFVAIFNNIDIFEGMDSE